MPQGIFCVPHLLFFVVLIGIFEVCIGPSLPLGEKCIFFFFFSVSFIAYPETEYTVTACNVLEQGKGSIHYKKV